MAGNAAVTHVFQARRQELAHSEHVRRPAVQNVLPSPARALVTTLGAGMETRFAMESGGAMENNCAAAEGNSIEVRPVQRVPDRADPGTVRDESVDAPRAKGAARLPRYRQKNPNTTSPHPAGLRMTDRIARIVYDAVAHTNTPHVAASDVAGAGMLLAANSGKRGLSEEAQTAGIDHLLDVGTRGESQLTYGRKSEHQLWDQTKYRALLTGDYQRAHPDHAEELGRIAAAVTQGPRWEDGPEDEANGSVHGEMTLAGEQIESWRRNRWPLGEGKIKEVAMGGVKSACGACQWTIDAVNEHIGKELGYELVASGSHGQLFSGWTLPAWLQGDARDEVMQKAQDVGWDWNGDVLVRTGDALELGIGSSQQPDYSDSEWEEIDSEENEMDSSWAATPAGGSRATVPPQPADVRPKRQRDDENEADEADSDPRAKRPRPDSNQLRGAAYP
ncbi:hypothetical protein ACQPZQ_16945 [Pseudonocardia sp. CA-142604]|uniref:hypothetical protein n=1 Tax=Pseudonocardia sp. CA-142604 TaxID=3240024 RepID=UPI003D8AF019